MRSFHIAAALVAFILLTNGPGASAQAAAASPAFTSAVSAANDTIADRWVAGGTEGLPVLLARARDAEFEGRGHALRTLARLLRATGLHSAEAESLLRAAAKDPDDHVRRMATVGLAALRVEAPAHPASARKLVAALIDGNAHVATNNAVVDRLLLAGNIALTPLRQALLDESFEGRGYAAWAIAKILRVTGKRPLAMTSCLHAAAGCESRYVSTLARSGLSILASAPPPSLRRRPTTAARMAEPSSGIQAVLREAPGPETDSGMLVAAIAERGGTWPDIVIDRLLLHGDDSLEPLLTAVRDESFAARGHAAWALGRLATALGRKDDTVREAIRSATLAGSPKQRWLARAGLTALEVATPLDEATATPAEIIAAFHGGKNVAVQANNALVDRLLLHGKAAIPALLVAISKPDGTRLFYADWAMAKVLRATGLRPADAMRILTERYAPGTSPILILGK